MITYGDLELTKEEFERMMESSEELDVEIKVKQKKEPMEKLNYRFGKGIQSECEEIAEMFDAHNQSDIARSAMALGLSELRRVIEDDLTKANGLVHIGKIRHELFK